MHVHHAILAQLRLGEELLTQLRSHHEEDLPEDEKISDEDFLALESLEERARLLASDFEKWGFVEDTTDELVLGPAGD